ERDLPQLVRADPGGVHWVPPRTRRRSQGLRAAERATAKREESRLPKAYVILTETIHDPEGMKAYAEKAAAASAPGMSMLAMDPDVQVLEGEWPEGRTIVLEFESVEAARAWY